MENAIINLANNIFSKEGLYALMFACLLVYVLKTNATREANYQGVIKHLTEACGIKLDELQKTILEFVRK